MSNLSYLLESIKNLTSSNALDISLNPNNTHVKRGNILDKILRNIFKSSLSTDGIGYNANTVIEQLMSAGFDFESVLKVRQILNEIIKQEISNFKLQKDITPDRNSFSGFICSFTLDKNSELYSNFLKSVKYKTLNQLKNYFD